MTLWSYIRSTDISYLRNTDMKNIIKDSLDLIGVLATTILLFYLCFTTTRLRDERNKYYKTTCILSDCCRNMIDNYGDPDSIYENYINIAYEEAGVKEEEFVNYSYCY